MKVNTRLMAILTILMFAGNVLTILPLANATVGGTLNIPVPGYKVAAGGPIPVDARLMTATGGTIYFYLSLDDDPEISSGDIYFASAKTEDATVDAITTLFLTASVSAKDYYVKGVDLKGVGKACVVSADTIEVIDEDIPTIEIDDTEGSVGAIPEITVEDADDYDDVIVSWEDFLGYDANSPYGITDGEAIIDDFEVPNAYKGTYKIIVWLTNNVDANYAAYVTFSVTPDVELELPSDPDGLSIEAEELDQTFIVHGTGFPEGTVDADSIALVLKNFMTGSTIDNYETRHLETDVGDVDDGAFDIEVTTDAVEAGIIDLKIPVGSTTTTFAAAFYSSTPTDPGDFAVITHYKISDLSGQNEDEVTFSFINLPAESEVTIRWIGATVTKDVASGGADIFGAYEEVYELGQLPGGAYTVRAVITTDGPITRERNMGTFTVLPKFEVSEDEAVVGDLVDLTGTGFPADASIQTSFFGDEEEDFGDLNVLDTGEFTVAGVAVPHVSGGGKSVTVKIEGEDSDGVAINAESTIIINSNLETIEAIIEGGDWDDPNVVFPGHIMKLTGSGFLAGETLAVNLYDEDDKLIGAAVVGDGEKADGDGDVELIAWLPNAKALYPAGKPDCYLKVAGSTSTNKDNSAAFGVDPSDDGTAFILFGIANDADFDIDVKVGETARVVGLGFRTKTLTLTIVDDVKTVNSVNGYFDTSFSIPELEGGYPNGQDYNLEVDETGTVAEFSVYPNMTLSPATGYIESTFTVTGTGFEDGTNFDITWVGIIGEEVLDTVDGDDVEDGSFTIDVTVPTVVPQSYKVQAMDEDDVWDDAVYTVADKAAVDQAAKLDAIIAQLNGVDFAGLKAQVAAAQAAAAAAQTSATAAQTTAAAAKTSADAAKTAADAVGVTANAAKTSADAAKTAADSAKTAADNAKAAADAGGVKVSEINGKVDGLQTLIYGAIGASLIAAIAAIVALMQISRKIA